MESFKFGVFSKNTLFRHFVLVCVCYHIFTNWTVQKGMEKVINMAFSVKAFHLKVMTPFHFRLQHTLYSRVCVTMSSPTVHSRLAEHENRFQITLRLKVIVLLPS